MAQEDDWKEKQKAQAQEKADRSFSTKPPSTSASSQSATLTKEQSDAEQQLAQAAAAKALADEHAALAEKKAKEDAASPEKPYTFTGEYHKASGSGTNPYTFTIPIKDAAVVDSSPTAAFRAQVHDDSHPTALEFRKQYPDFGRLATHHLNSSKSIEDVA